MSRLGGILGAVLAATGAGKAPRERRPIKRPLLKPAWKQPEQPQEARTAALSAAEAKRARKATKALRDAQAREEGQTDAAHDTHELWRTEQPLTNMGTTTRAMMGADFQKGIEADMRAAGIKLD